jgi:hypothetical protein
MVSLANRKNKILPSAVDRGNQAAGWKNERNKSIVDAYYQTEACYRMRFRIPSKDSQSIVGGLIETVSDMQRRGRLAGSTQKHSQGRWGGV